MSNRDRVLAEGGGSAQPAAQESTAPAAATPASSVKATKKPRKANGKRQQQAQSVGKGSHTPTSRASSRGRQARPKLRDPFVENGMIAQEHASSWFLVAGSCALVRCSHKCFPTIRRVLDCCYPLFVL